MKEGWINSKIGDICSITDFVSNGSFASLRENVKYYNEPNYAVLVRLADASNGFDKSKFVYTDKRGYDFSKKSHLHGGELIMSNVGSVGSMFICPVMKQPMALAPNTISITSQNNKFLYYYFLSDGFKAKLKSITTSTTLKKFNKTNFKLLEICIPSLSEQQSIVDYLDSAFAKIDAMKANAEKSLNEAKVLFQASLKEMLEPKDGWDYSTIGDLCDKMNGLWKGKTGPFVNVGVIRNANFTKSFTLSFDNIEYLDVEAKQYKTRKLQKGDLIVEKSGGSEKQPVGRTVLFDKEDGEYSFSNFTSVLRIKDRNVISPEFLYRYILYIYLRGDTRKMQKATTGIHNIEFDKFLAIPVPKLHLSEQQSIVDYLDTLGIKVDRLQENYDKISQECDALKQAILRQVFE